MAWRIHEWLTSKQTNRVGQPTFQSVNKIPKQDLQPANGGELFSEEDPLLLMAWYKLIVVARLPIKSHHQIFNLPEYEILEREERQPDWENIVRRCSACIKEEELSRSYSALCPHSNVIIHKPRLPLLKMKQCSYVFLYLLEWRIRPEAFFTSTLMVFRD